MELIINTLAEQPSLLYCVDEDRAKVVLKNEAFKIVTEKLRNEKMGKNNCSYIKNLEGGNIKMAWVKYDDAVKQKCLDLIKQGKTISEVVGIVNGPKKKALIRWTEHSNVSYKK